MRIISRYSLDLIPKLIKIQGVATFTKIRKLPCRFEIIFLYLKLSTSKLDISNRMESFFKSLNFTLVWLMKSEKHDTLSVKTQFLSFDHSKTRY